MRTTLLVLLLTACSCWGQAFTLRDPAFVGQQKAAGVACNTTCSANGFCERFNYLSWDVNWTNLTAGDYSTVTNNVNTARNSCSTSYAQWHHASSGAFMAYSNNAAWGTTYVDFWFRVEANNMGASTSVRVVSTLTSGSLTCSSLLLTNSAGSQLSLLPLYRDSNFNDHYTNFFNITAGTWYHVGLEYHVGNNGVFNFYCGTTQTFGAAVATAADTSNRNPQLFEWGTFQTVGSWGSGNMDLDFDSMTLDTTGFKPVEY